MSDDIAQARVQLEELFGETITARIEAFVRAIVRPDRDLTHPYRCSACGSPDVQHRVSGWLDAADFHHDRTGRLELDAEADDGTKDSDRGWCRACGGLRLLRRIDA